MCWNPDAENKGLCVELCGGSEASPTCSDESKFNCAVVNDGVLAYPAPEGAPISWLSHKTLGDFFVAASEHDEAAGQTYHVGGPEALTSADLAGVLAERLGRPVTYSRIPLEGFAAGLNAAFGPPAGDRIASIYQQLEAHPQAMDAGQTAAHVLDVRAESFADFAARNDWQIIETAS